MGLQQERREQDRVNFTLQNVIISYHMMWPSALVVMTVRVKLIGQYYSILVSNFS